jgi:hypothetical protein
MCYLGSDKARYVTHGVAAGAPEGFPIVTASFWSLRNYALFHNEFSGV